MGRFFKYSFLLLAIGCATSLKDSLASIESGMDKSEVIDKVGSPNRSYRKDEQDIWLYRVHEEDESHLHEITFKDGHVVYTGPERDLSPKKGASLRSTEEAQEELRRKLQPNKKPKEFKDIKEDGTY
jgi:outer membrane protein assembly factor BamE (lipoprotein component of BamABCDE complex)